MLVASQHVYRQVERRSKSCAEAALTDEIVDQFRGLNNGFQDEPDRVLKKDNLVSD